MNNLLGRPSVAIAIATGWLLGATQPASAALVNGSFESGAFAPDAQGVQFINITGSPIEGWSGFVGGFYWVGPANAYGIVASDGAYSVSLYDPTRPLVRVGSVNQTLATTVGQSYELAFDLGTAGGFSRNVGIRAFAGGQSADFLSAAAGPGMHGNGSSCASPPRTAPRSSSSPACSARAIRPMARRATSAWTT